MGNFLFFGSVTLIFLSSYFYTSILKPKRFVDAFIYFVCAVFSQIIVSVEILSIPSKLTPSSLSVSHVLLFVFGFLIWKKFGSPIYKIEGFKTLVFDIKRALIKDKVLIFLAFFFILSVIGSLLITIFSPPNHYDSMNYHLARVPFWIQYHSVNHYPTTSIAQLIHPINSEILMLWSMIFTKGDWFVTYPYYFSYIGIIIVLWAFLSLLNISVERKLWTVFIFASLPIVIVQSSSILIDIMVAFFIFASLYLFYCGIIENRKKSIIFSAITFAIAIGLKTTIFFVIPPFAVAFLLVSGKYLRKDFYKPIILFVSVLLPFFIILSSYNYIQNFLSYGHPVGLKSFILRHSIDKPYYFQGIIVNFIKHFLMLIDFSGIDLVRSYTHIGGSLLNSIVNVLGFNKNWGSAGLRGSYYHFTEFNPYINENHVFWGILGFLVFLPYILKSAFTKVFKESKRGSLIGISGLLFLFFMTCIITLAGYQLFNTRFMLVGVVLAAPVLAYSYDRHFSLYKIFISIIAIFFLFKITFFNPIRPILPLITWGGDGRSVFISSRDEIRYTRGRNSPYPIIQYILQQAPDGSRIGLIESHDNWYYLFYPHNPTYKIYPLRYSELKEERNFDDYDFIIVIDNPQITYNEEAQWPVYVNENIDFSIFPSNFEIIPFVHGQPQDWDYYSCVILKNKKGLHR